MGLFSRPGSGTAVALHARVADGEHLWLAVSGAESLVLRGAPVGDIAVPGEVEDDLLTAVFPLAAALAEIDADEVELRVCHGPRATPVVAELAKRPDSPTVEAPTTVDGRWQLAVRVVDDEVVVRRTRVAPSVPVLGLAAVEDGVELRFAPERASTVSVRDASWPVHEGAVVLGAVPGLAPGTQAPLLVDGLPATRSRSVLVRPHFAVALPPMLEDDVELRWLKDGRLVVVRREAQS